MAVSQAQIVDLLYKQAFGVTKTDTATNKSPSNENIPSPLLLRGDTLWTQANQIPGVAAATAGIVQAYTGVTAVECTADNTTVPIGGVYPTWLTSLTYWIPSEFGSTYTAQVWIDNPGAANPTLTGTQIFAAGSGGTGQYYYNYQSGVLNFIGETIPAGLTSGKVLYIVGYRYIGLLGVTNLPSGTNIGNISINGSTISSKSGSNANITITPDGSGVVVFTKDISSTANISAGNLSLTGSANITGNITANYISGNGAGITGVTATSADKLSNGNSTVNVLANGNVTFNIANTANGNVPVSNVLVVSSNGISVDGALNVTGNINGANINGNISGNISGNFTISGPNTGVVFNDSSLANSTLGFTFDKTSNVANIANTLNVGNLLTVNGAINAFSTLNLTGNISLGNLYENQITNLSNSSLQISGGYNNASGQLSLFTGSATDSAKIVLSAASNSIATQADTFTFYNRGNTFTLLTVSNTTTVTTSTTTGALVANGGVGVSGNIFVGGLINVAGNITTSALISPSLTSNFANLLLTAAAGDNSVVLSPTGNGTVDVSSKRITSLATPTASTDAATKQYVDDVAQGLNIHDSTKAATANSLANLTGGTITYNNGASGVGANLVLTGSPTANFISANVFDGNVTLVATNRLLVKNETNAAYNGIYVVSNATVLTRADDFNSVPEIEAGDFVFVTGGSTYDNTGWVQTSTVVIVGTDPIDWTQFSGAGTYQAGNGLTLTGSVFSVNVDNNTTAIVGGNVVVKDGANLTTPNIGAATGTSLAVLDGLTGNTLTANLTLSVTGNANVGNLGTAGLIVASGNVTGGNILTGGIVSATGNGTFGNLSTTGNISGANVVSANTFSGNLLATTANISGNTITSNLTVNLAFSGNTANFSGNVTSNGLTTSNTVTVTSLNTANAIVYTDSNGNLKQSANLTFSGTELTVTGSANISGNVSVGNLSTTGNLSVNAFTANRLSIGNTAITANTVTTSAITANQTIATFQLTGSNVTGIEFLVKGVDTVSLSNKYSVATVLAVTNGTDVDYTIYSTVRIGTTTGSLAVNIDSGNVALQVTPSTSAATVWTTQIRTI
jgi:cytoskeletal protein CcmA (bactofilin family)